MIKEHIWISEVTDLVQDMDKLLDFSTVFYKNMYISGSE